MNNTLMNFVKHCMEDEEYNRGGIPTKEKMYLKKLGIEIGSEELRMFYDAMYILYELNKKLER